MGRQKVRGRRWASNSRLISLILTAALTVCGPCRGAQVRLCAPPSAATATDRPPACWASPLLPPPPPLPSPVPHWAAHAPSKWAPTRACNGRVVRAAVAGLRRPRGDSYRVGPGQADTHSHARVESGRGRISWPPLRWPLCAVRPVCCKRNGKHGFWATVCPGGQILENSPPKHCF